MSDELTNLTEQIHQELELLQPIVSEMLSLPSQWNGSVEIVEQDILNPVRGKKRFGCSIEITLTTAQSESRWRTLLYKLIHAHSVGINSDSLSRYNGWEEGVVENLQRLLRVSILEQAGVRTDPAFFAAEDAEFSLQEYVDAVEDLRRELAYEEVADRDSVLFYRDLLAIRLAERPGYVMEKGRLISQKSRLRFLRRFSEVNGRLCRGPKIKMRFDDGIHSGT